ncbi:MAG: ROK family protein [Solirubrobacteraceae bacterium]
MPELFGGVETGGTWCVCALGRGPRRMLAHETFPTTTPEQTLDRIVAFFAARPAPVAIGVGSFGPVQLDPAAPDWGCVTATPKSGWEYASVAPVLRDRLGVPVIFDTDVNAAAVGEQRWGAGRRAANLCYLTVGTGIGAGLVIDGRPVHGLVHPEAGHLRIPHDRRRDPFAGACRFHGDCWEGLASGPALAARWRVAPEELPDDHPAWALEAEYIAHGMLSIVLVASPELMIVGGGVLERSGLLAMVRARLRGLLAGYLENPLLGADIERYVVAPELGDDAGVLGAIALAQRSQVGR